MIKPKSILISVVPEDGDRAMIMEYVDAGTFYDMHPEIKYGTLKTWASRGKIPNAIQLSNGNFLYPVDAQLPALWTDKRTGKTNRR